MSDAVTDNLADYSRVAVCGKLALDNREDDDPSGDRGGEVRYRGTVTEGIEDAPEAFLGPFEGTNAGKRLVEVG